MEKEPDEAVEASFGRTLAFMTTLWELNHAMEVTSKRMEQTLGVTAQQRVLIRLVGRAPGITQGELAKLLHLHKTTLSLAVDRLEKRELMTRERDETDGRRVGLRLTAKGKQLDRPSKGTVESSVEDLLGSVSPDVIAAARTCLDELTKRLTDAT